MWTASAATCGSPIGCCRRSRGWTTSSLTPSRPGDFIVATTVPTTRASCISGGSARAGIRRGPATGCAGDTIPEAAGSLQVLPHLGVELGDDAVGDAGAVRARHGGLDG